MKNGMIQMCLLMLRKMIIEIKDISEFLIDILSSEIDWHSDTTIKVSTFIL